MSFFNKLFNKKQLHVSEGKIPEHIAIIMDGNGRWAKKRALPRNLGHREGSNALRKIVKFSDKIGIKYLTVYAFSTENWKRPKSEVDGLMSLLLGYLRNAEEEIGGRNVRIRVIGDIKGLPNEVQEEVARVLKSTEKNTGMVFNIALNYGSRDEIINAVKSIASDVKNGKMKIENINEQTLTNHLYAPDIPDPDLIIRTSGEQRISNFLLWQAAYSEFYFTEILWPDFTEEKLLEAVNSYQSRNRRFGGI